jgi:hypothetical protein
MQNQAQKLLLLLAVLLSVLAVPAGAASLTVPGPQACLQQAPFFSDAPALGSANLLFPPPQRCGACSTGGCAGSAAFSKCGVGRNGQYLYCVDGGTCPADGLLFCSCSQPS